MGIEVVTFGCRLNGAESEAVRAQAEAAGAADLVVVNTCAVTGEATRQAAKAVRRLGRERPSARVVVTGCAAQIEPDRFAAMPGVAAVLGNTEKHEASLWSAVATGAGQRGAPLVAVGDIMAARRVASGAAPAAGGRVRAPVQVQNGCDHRCTFCVIPFGRGSSRSLPVTEAIAAVREAVEAGVREVVLTGIDLTAYGADLPDRPRLGRLVRSILAAAPELPRLRLSSIDSIEVDDELLGALADEERLMPHLHLSLQAGDDLVLKRMKRRHGRADAIAFCAAARRLRPDIVFGADLIAGFPTETDAMFERSLDLVAECGLTYLHVFPYSPRPGTPAARMPPVLPEVARARARRLRQAGDDALAGHLRLQVGQSRRVLAETGTTARAEDFAPVRLPRPVRAGDLLEVRIAAASGRELLAA